MLAGCSFSTSVTNEVMIDGADPVDAAIDAVPDVALLPVCNVGVTTMPGADRGHVGSDTGGGVNFGPLRCTAATDRIIGFGIRTSNGNTLFNARSAHGLTIACAPVTVDPNTGTGTFGTMYVVEVKGSGAEGWTPSTLVAPTLCPAGMVVNGLRAYTGPGQNLFTNLDFRCGQLDGTTAMTIANPVVHVANSLTETQNPDTVNCGTNEILVELPNRTGSGFDSVDLFCAPAKCL